MCYVAIFDYFGGYLVVTVCYLVVTARYCLLLCGYWWLLLVAARYCSFPLLVWTELWGLAELLNLINTEIKTRANCGEYSFSQGDEFDHLDLRTTSALAFQASKSISDKCVFCLGQHWSDKCDVPILKLGKFIIKIIKDVFIV